MRFLKTKVQEKTSEGNLYVLLKIHTYMTTRVYLQLWLWQPASPLATLMFNNNCEITGTLKASSKHCDSDFWCTKRKLHGCWFTECQSESLEDVCYKKVSCTVVCVNICWTLPPVDLLFYTWRKLFFCCWKQCEISLYFGTVASGVIQNLWVLQVDASGCMWINLEGRVFFLSH